ncbi:FG-GAP repeat protein [Acrocarpospora phusangensis]|uniref:FG-GAP repeat protein n=1 Tax=Acrocarpospora phusangensis TaxID=1070424 RepID=UPI00194EC3A1|nr:FG-GAP repeat protein [Acrocarpospora phusangensis]
MRKRAAALVGALILGLLGAGSPPAGACAKAPADFTGDGVNDAFVTDPVTSGSALEGRSYVLVGPVLNAQVKQLDQGAGWTAKAGHLDGDRCLDVVVSNPYASGVVDGRTVPGAGVAYVYWGGAMGGPRLELKAPSPRGNAHFGWSLAIASGTVAVGAPHEDADEVADSGAAYVFRFDGRKPGEPQRITQNSPGVPGNAQAGDMFGWSLAYTRLGGNASAVDLAIGAPFEDREEAGQIDTGSVTLVYDVATRPWTYRGVGWDMSTVEAGMDSRSGDHFGHSLAFGTYAGKGYLAIGAPAADLDGVRDSGLALLFESTSGDPRLIRTLHEGAVGIGDTPEAGDMFGHALAFMGPTLLVGVPGQSELRRPESGTIQAIPIDSTEVSRLIRLAEGRPYDHFGWSLARTGDGFVLVGVPDRGATGAVAVVSVLGERPRLLTPEGDALEFGAAVTG